MGSLIVTWSPFVGQGGSSTLTASLASVMALDSTDNILFTHARSTKTVLDTLFNVSNENSLTKKGLAGLDRLIKSKLICPESIPDYTDSVYIKKLDYLQSGYLEEKSEREYAANLISVIGNALNIYDYVFVNLDSGLTSLATKALLNQADVVVVAIPQSKHSVEMFYKNIPKEIASREFIVVITNYDQKATYSVRNIKRQSKLKQEVVPFPYVTDLKNAINLNDFSGFYFNAVKSKKQDSIALLLENIRKANETILLKLGRNVGSETVD